MQIQDSILDTNFSSVAYFKDASLVLPVRNSCWFASGNAEPQTHGTYFKPVTYKSEGNKIIRMVES
jgi:hypothetical protein